MATGFVLLGEIEVRAGGQPVGMGHIRQRLVLASLLMDANRVVSADQLIDRVWGDNPPMRPRNALYVYLSRLRRVLQDAGCGVITRQTGGYALTVEARAVDVHRFRALRGQADTADDQQAATLLGEALDLWQGEAFAGADTPWFIAQRNTLATEQFAAQIDLADIQLRLGEHHRLLPQLLSRADEYPLNERAAGQLILALHRCGRTADALNRFHETRKVLSDELGIDPGADLSRLFEQILAADRRLDLPTKARRAHRPVPRQLPRAPAAFTGREDALSWLTDSLSPAGNASRAVVISAVSGTGGIGKTGLALHWAHENAADFPDGQLYTNLRGFDPSARPTSPRVALRGFLDALAADPTTIPAEPDAQAAMYRSMMADKRMLIVLDNAHDSEQVAPLLPGSSSCAVLVTSRRQLAGLFTGYGARPFTLGILSPGEARQLLTRQLGAARTEAEPQAVAELLGHCAGLPLALSIVAARATMQPGIPLAALAGELSQDSARLDALDAGESAANLRAVFSWSYQPLNPRAARLFRLLGAHPGLDIAASVAASLTGDDLHQVSQGLRELAQAHLVTEHTPGRFTMHDLVRVYAAELFQTVESPVEQRAATHRVLDHYLLSAHAADSLAAPYRHPIPLPTPQPGVVPEKFAGIDQAMDWCAAEHPSLLAALDRAAVSGFDTHAWQLAWSLTHFLEYNGHQHDWVAVQHIALAAAQRLGDPLSRMEAHRGLGRAYVHHGHADAEPHLRQALELAAELGDLTGQAHTHIELAKVVSVQDRWQEALEHSQQALELYRAGSHRIGVARALNSCGWCQIHLGNYEEALSYCAQALDAQIELGDVTNVANTLDSLAYTHFHLGEYREAVAHYERAIDIHEQKGDISAQGRCLHRLGDAYQAMGDIPAARRAWQLALDIQDEAGHPDADRIRTKLQG